MAISDEIAVMSRGELLQVGLPHELYYAPRNLFVAQFIGRANLIPATVIAVSPAAVTLSILSETWTVPPAATPLQPGARVRAMVRPEAIALRREEGPDGLGGTVVEAVFLGEKSEYGIELGTRDRLTVTTTDPTLAGLKRGDAVVLTLRADLIRLFPEASG